MPPSTQSLPKDCWRSASSLICAAARTPTSLAAATAWQPIACRSWLSPCELERGAVAQAVEAAQVAVRYGVSRSTPD